MDPTRATCCCPPGSVQRIHRAPVFERISDWNLYQTLNMKTACEITRSLAFCPRPAAPASGERYLRKNFLNSFPAPAGWVDCFAQVQNGAEAILNAERFSLPNHIMISLSKDSLTTGMRMTPGCLKLFGLCSALVLQAKQRPAIQTYRQGIAHHDMGLVYRKARVERSSDLLKE